MSLAPWRVLGRTLPLDRAHLMGVVNVTPDSFSDGGQFLDTGAAVDHALDLVAQGAAILDIGGESTRPGAEPVSLHDELERVLPVISWLCAESDALISIDTTKAAVAEAALEAGAHIVNDISGLGFDPDMADVVGAYQAGLVLMHIQGVPRTMQRGIAYEDVTEDVLAYFRQRIQQATDAGVHPEAIVLDPGIGFGKTVDHNLELLRQLHRFTELGHGVLLGTSRKSFLGALLDGRPPEDRVFGTAATTAAGVLSGARIFRVHDVAPMRDIVVVTEAIARGRR